MSRDVEILMDDLKAAQAAFRSSNFHLINIYGNRLVTNAVIFELEGYSLAGWTLKDISIYINQLIPNNRLDEKKKMIGETLKEIEEALDNDEKEKLWNIYFKVQRSFLDLTNIENERDIYRENMGLVEKYLHFIIETLDSDRHFLMKRGNRFLNGLVNELDRILRSYGPTEQGLMLQLLLKAFNSVYNYLVLSSLDKEGKLDEEQFRAMAYPVIDQIVEIFNGEMNDDLDESKKEVRKVLDGISKKWRMGYIHFKDIETGRERTTEQRIDLPPDTKRKIEEALADILQEEIE